MKKVFIIVGIIILAVVGGKDLLYLVIVPSNREIRLPSEAALDSVIQKDMGRYVYEKVDKIGLDASHKDFLSLCDSAIHRGDSVRVCENVVRAYKRTYETYDTEIEAERGRISIYVLQYKSSLDVRRVLGRYIIHFWYPTFTIDGATFIGYQSDDWWILPVPGAKMVIVFWGWHPTQEDAVKNFIANTTK